MKIYINLQEDTMKFMGAYSTLERALDGGVGKLNYFDDAILTIPYTIDANITDGDLTVEDIINAKGK